MAFRFEVDSKPESDPVVRVETVKNEDGDVGVWVNDQVVIWFNHDDGCLLLQKMDPRYYPLPRGNKGHPKIRYA